MTNPGCDAYLAGELAQYLQQVINSTDSSYTFIHFDQMDCTYSVNRQEQSVPYKYKLRVQTSKSRATFNHSSFATTGAGHSFTWCNELYLSQLDELDALVGQLLDVVDASDVLVLLSSDHGGQGTSHGRYIDEDLFIPMFVKGRWVVRCLP